ncbi:MAG: choice-of-anchor D domain-containing protein [Bacteroidetes bacterium]|nr:choice-of-anchor D domain-containing protein [Bacteroidota bacterium]
MKISTITRFLILFLFTFTGLKAQFPASCDKDKSCNNSPALTLTVFSDKGTHYVDVTKYSIKDKTQTALTFEGWLNLTRVAGKQQFIGGLWGPSFDVNDVWVVYISPNDELVFEVNGDGTKLKSTDNTIVRYPFGAYFGKWTHFSAVFDGAGKTCYLYINGIQVAAANNPLYPTSYLRPTDEKQQSKVPLQIGSCNGLSDNKSQFQNFKGQMDEIRIWTRVLTPTEIICQKDKELNGNEAGLLVYYRCNEAAGVINLCDATGKGYVGEMKSGASCQKSTRTVPQTVVASPTSISGTIKCVNTDVYNITIMDTSICGSSVTMRIDNRDASAFSLSQNSATLNPQVPFTFQVRFNSSLIGNIIADLKIIPTNSCGTQILIPIRLTRLTELRYTINTINFDTLFAGCKEQLYKDTTFRICNQSDSVGAARPLTLNGFTVRYPQLFQVVSPATFPQTIGIGKCIDITVRFYSKDTSGLYYDTLKTLSDDKCPGIVVIPLRGVVRDVVGVFDAGGTKRLDSAKFGTECIGQLSNPILWTWKNLTSRPVTVDTIIIPNGFTGRSLRFPFSLLPNTGYQQNVIRFFPNRSGLFKDSITIIARIQGSNCSIIRKIYVSGRGYEAKVEWSTKLADFGNVIVGQEKTMTVTCKNSAPDDLRVSFYPKSGEVFFLTGAKSVTIKTGETVSIPITFRPITDSLYVDQLCLFEQRCFTSACIPIQGRGVIETFRYDPIVMRTENVVGCQSALDTLDIINIVNTDQILSQIQLSDPSGRYTIIDPISIPASITVPVGKSARFIFRYTPNDVTQDRADRAYLKYISQNVQWAAPLFGTSATPKLSITTLTVFGTLEVGDKKRDSITIENISILPVRVDSLYIPPGFTMISASRPMKTILQPRDSIQVVLEFAPTAAQTYDGQVKVFSESPCPSISSTGNLKARGIILKLEAPLSLINWGFVKPCDCITRELPLVNQSLVHPMSVDSLWIDSLNIPGGTPQFWTWTSAFSPKGTFPFSIPPDTRDTVRITFCPRTPAEDKYVDCAARMHLNASGSGWNAAYEVYLLGKRSLLYKPSPPANVFVPARVDTISTPRIITVIIPSILTNPDQYPVIIDSVSFKPDERVFTYSDTKGRPFPITLNPGDTLRIRVDFKPRAHRTYSAKMLLYVSNPCKDIDTTVLVSGNGFAPAFGLDFNFDNKRIEIDTFKITTCDTLFVPIFSTRQIPANLVDIFCRLGYDTTEFRYVGATSNYLNTKCFPQYTPSIIAKSSPTVGTEFILKNFCAVDSLQPFLIAKFISITGQRADKKITVDSISFDTEQTILFQILAGADEGRVIVQKTEITIIDTVNFDSVRVLDCADRTITVKNTGDVPVVVDSLPGLGKDMSIVGSVPPSNQPLNVGDSIVFTVRFCPSRELPAPPQLKARSIVPCTVFDSTSVAGMGYAPDVPMGLAFSKNFIFPDSLAGTLGDTVTIPVFIEKDFSATYKGTTYWLKAMNFDVNINYNARMLKFLSASSPITQNLGVAPTLGSVQLNYTNMDDVKAGEIASLKFLVTVPDTLISPMRVVASNFHTDSLQFIDIIPLAGRSPFIASGKCTITTLKYSTANPSLSQNRPNPFNNSTSIEFTTQETTPVTLKVYSMTGSLVRTVLDGSQTLIGGTYSIDLSAEELNAGVYYYVLQAGLFFDSRTMTVVK